MANPQRGETALELDGHTYHLRVTLNTLAEAQEILGLNDFNAIMARLSPNADGTATADFVTMRALVCAALRDHIPKLTPRDAGAMVGIADLNRVMAAIGAALNSAFTPATDPNGEDTAPLATPTAPAAAAGPAGMN